MATNSSLVSAALRLCIAAIFALPGFGAPFVTHAIEAPVANSMLSRAQAPSATAIVAGTNDAMPRITPQNNAVSALKRVYLPSIVDGCTVGAVPVALGLDPFYTKYCAVGNLPIVSSSGVPDRAVRIAARAIQRMLSKRPDVLAKIAQNHTRVGIIGINQVTSDMPEYRNIYNDFPGVDWNTRARGLGDPVYAAVIGGRRKRDVLSNGSIHRREHSGARVRPHDQAYGA